MACYFFFSNHFVEMLEHVWFVDILRVVNVYTDGMVCDARPGKIYHSSKILRIITVASCKMPPT